MPNIVEFEHILKYRASASTPPTTRFQEDQSFTTEEKIEGETRLPDSSATVELSMGLIAEGLFFYMKSDEPIAVYFGDPVTTDPVVANFLVLGVDAGEGFTEVHLVNDNGNTDVATVEYLIAGDAT